MKRGALRPGFAKIGDSKDLSCDAFRILFRQVNDGRAKIFYRSGTPAVFRVTPIVIGGHIALEHFSDYRARTEGVGGDVLTFVFIRKPCGKAVERGLCYGVHDKVRHRGIRRGGRGDIHDTAAALLNHVGYDSLGGEKGATNVHIDVVVEEFRRHVEKWAAGVVGSVVDETIDTPEAIDALRGEYALDKQPASKKHISIERAMRAMVADNF